MCEKRPHVWAGLWAMCALDPQRPRRNPAPSLGPFSLFRNERVELIEFQCPASTDILEYSWGCTLPR